MKIHLGNNQQSFSFECLRLCIKTWVPRSAIYEPARGYKSLRWLNGTVASGDEYRKDPSLSSPLFFFPSSLLLIPESHWSFCLPIRRSWTPWPFLFHKDAECLCSEDVPRTTLSLLSESFLRPSPSRWSPYNLCLFVKHTIRELNIAYKSKRIR